MAAGIKVPMFAEDPHPPPIVGHHSVPDWRVWVEPGQELECVPVAGVRLPVPVWPEDLWPVLGNQLHQLWSNLFCDKSPCGQVVRFVLKYCGRIEIFLHTCLPGDTEDCTTQTRNDIDQTLLSRPFWRHLQAPGWHLVSVQCLDCSSQSFGYLANWQNFKMSRLYEYF